jgi:hypothetical protein
MSNPEDFDEVEDKAPHDRAKDSRRRYTDWREVERGLKARPGQRETNNNRYGEWDPEK